MGRRLLFKTCSRTPEELRAEMRGTVINGHAFSLDDTKSVEEICGDIGVVYPPADYAAWPRCRLYTMHDTEAGLLGYAAVRFDGNANGAPTFVIDAFGVMGSLRGRGAGKALFDYIKEDLCRLGGSERERSVSWRRALADHGILPEEATCTMSIQSTFDFGSYSEALAKHTSIIDTACVGAYAGTRKKNRDTARQQTVTVDAAAVLRDTHGSCDFWRKMGFDNEELICSGRGFSLATPIVIMWQKISTYP